MEIITVVGARPQFIKAAVVSRALAKIGLKEKILHTGQHFDPNMSDVFFDQLEIPRPAFNLDIHGGTHGAMTAKMLSGIEEILLKEKPQYVLVYGDTNSTLAGALAASKLHIPVAHVEAGLRSFNRKMPEEINRVLTDHVSTLLFAPTDVGARHLANEGIPASQVHTVGDVMFDASLYYGARASALKGLAKGQYILVTLHRQENIDHPERLDIILRALLKVSESHELVWPLHPRARAKVEAALKGSKSIQLIDPVGYLEMIALEKNAGLVATDSGGVQKEAFFYQVPCVTLRDETEWTELVESGWNRLSPPTSVDAIVSAVSAAWGTRGREVKPYGDGRAGEKIADLLAQS